MAEEDARTASELFDKDRPDREAAIGLVGATIYRAKALFDPVPYPCEPPRPASEIKATYKIALIPYRLTVKTRENTFVPGGARPPDHAIILREREFDHFDLCVKDDDRVPTIRSWCDHIVQLCTSALATGASFVLLPELSHPNFWSGRPAEDFWGKRRAEAPPPDRRRLLDSARRKLDRRLQALSTKHKAVIISGSYHDCETFENISPIYFPDASKSRNHKKLTTAYTVREQVKTARGVGYPVYSALGRRFCVLICTDAFDLNMFFRQAIATGSAHQPTTPEIYFVPSFYVPQDETHAMREACQQLSFASGQAVVFVNQAEDRPVPIAVFAAGVEVIPEVVVPPGEGDSIYTVELSTALISEHAERSAGMRTALSSLLKTSRKTFG